MLHLIALAIIIVVISAIHFLIFIFIILIIFAFKAIRFLEVGELLDMRCEASLFEIFLQGLE